MLILLRGDVFIEKHFHEKMHFPRRCREWIRVFRSYFISFLMLSSAPLVTEWETLVAGLTNDLCLSVGVPQESQDWTPINFLRPTSRKNSDTKICHLFLLNAWEALLLLPLIKVTSHSWNVFSLPFCLTFGTVEDLTGRAKRNLLERRDENSFAVSPTCITRTTHT